MDKEDLKRFRENLKRVFEILGSFEVKALDDEKLARENARRSLVAKRDIPKGKVIEYEDLTFKRPASGVSPKFIDNIIGKRASRDINEDEPIKWNFLEEI
jgi:N-acetylneuraminate synthase